MQGTMTWGIAAGALAVALLNCFLGYQLRKLWVALGCCVAGGAAGMLLAAQFVPQNAVLPIILAGIAGAVLLTALSFKLYLAGVFILCMGLVWVAAYAFIPWRRWAVILGLAVGILAGVLAVKWTRAALILTTAASGGASVMRTLMVTEGVAQVVNASAPLSAVLLAAAVALAVLGAVVQFRTTRPKP